MNLNLSTQLLLDFALLQLVLMEYFKRANKAHTTLSSNVNPTKFALSKWAADLEHTEVELLGRRRLLVDWVRAALQGRFLGRATGGGVCNNCFARGRRRWRGHVGTAPLRSFGGYCGSIQSRRLVCVLESELEKVWAVGVRSELIAGSKARYRHRSRKGTLLSWLVEVGLLLFEAAWAYL